MAEKETWQVIDAPKDSRSSAANSMSNDQEKWAVVPDGNVSSDGGAPSQQIAAQSELDNTADNVRSAVGNLALKTNPLDLAVEGVEGNLTKQDPLEGATGDMLDGALQSATFGVPKAIAKKILEANNLSYPEPKDKTAENIGKIIGLLAPTAVAENITSKIAGFAGKTLAADMARGASTGAMVGFSQSPDDFMDIGQRIKQAGLGVVVGAAIPPLAKSIGALSSAAFKADELAQQVRASLFQAKSNIGKQFESQLNDLISKNPSKLVDLENAFTELKTGSLENSRLISDLKTGAKRAGLDPKVIQGFIDHPQTASQMTLNQSREIKNVISNIPGIKQNYAKPALMRNWSDTHVDLLDFADQIKKAQLDQFPQLANINKTFSEKLNQYNMIKSKFKVGQLLKNMSNNFGDPEVKKIVNSLLPQETIRQIGGYRMATKFLRLAGNIAKAGALGAAGWEGTKLVR